MGAALRAVLGVVSDAQMAALVLGDCATHHHLVAREAGKKAHRMTKGGTMAARKKKPAAHEETTPEAEPEAPAPAPAPVAPIMTIVLEGRPDPRLEARVREAIATKGALSGLAAVFTELAMSGYYGALTVTVGAEHKAT